MRMLNNEMKKKRGCMYCADLVHGRRNGCPHDECPYHELDKYETYNQYMKQASPLTISQLLKLMNARYCD